MNPLKGIKISLKTNSSNDKNTKKKPKSWVSTCSYASESTSSGSISGKAVFSSSFYSSISDISIKSYEGNNGILENVSSKSLTEVPQAVTRLYEKGIEDANNNLYGKALDKLEEALSLTKNSEMVSYIRIEIGKVLYHFSQYKQSAMHFNAARKVLLPLVRNRNCDDDGSYLIATLQEVIAYDDDEDNTNLVSYYQAVIRLGSILLGKLHIDTAIVNQKVGDLYCDQEYFKESVPYFKAALKAHLYVTRESPEISSLLFKLGRVYYETDQYNSALKYFTSNLSMDKSLYGEKHSLAHTYLLIGQIHLNTSRVEEAITNFSKALSFLSFSNPNHHEDLSSILLRIGIAYIRQQDYASAEQVYTQRLSLQKTMYASANDNLAETYNQLATIQMSRKHFQKGLHSYLQLLHLQRMLLGREHYKIALLLIHIGDIYQYNLGSLSSAISVYEEAFRILKLHSDTHKTEEHRDRLYSLQSKITAILLSADSCEGDCDDTRWENTSNSVLRN